MSFRKQFFLAHFSVVPALLNVIRIERIFLFLFFPPIYFNMLVFYFIIFSVFFFLFSFVLSLLFSMVHFAFKYKLFFFVSHWVEPDTVSAYKLTLNLVKYIRKKSFFEVLCSFLFCFFFGVCVGLRMVWKKLFLKRKIEK